MPTKAKKIANLLRQAAEVADMFDPFSDKTPSHRHSQRVDAFETEAEKLVNKLAAYLAQKGEAFTSHPEASVTQAPEFADWIDSEMDEALQKPEWDENDIARLCALFFLYMAA